ncbi:hypothetical protein AAF712_008153 [Marasmius tenuissimus]|uniref:ARM repeat superfamily protein n=1 Tax=Marasmius tenuissimus TaxID=585030 RepID=A0ABR2ZUA4_9AGAR
MDKILAQIEDWGSYEGAAIDHGPVESPVEDIKKGLKDALKFTSGTFAHSDAYLDGPVPFLNLDGIGLVGLPLGSETQAELIVGASRPITRGLQRFPGEKVRISNPRWDVWLKDSVLPQVYDALGIYIQNDEPVQLHLSSLIMQIADANPEIYTEENCVDMRKSHASLLVVLPSQDTEGSTISFVPPSQDDQSKAFSAVSHGITVVSSLPGTTRTISPSRAGNVLMLEYQVLSPGEHDTTSRSFNGAAMPQLSQVFRSWKEMLRLKPQDAPHLLAFVLNGIDPPVLNCKTEPHQESQIIKPSSLKEADRRILASIAPVAKTYGFDIYLGQIEYSQHGLLDTGGLDPETTHESKYLKGDPDDAEFNRVEDWDGEYREELDVECVFSLDGIPMELTSSEVFDYEPEEWQEHVLVNGQALASGPKESIVESYQAMDGGPYLNRTWHPTVMFILFRDLEETQIVLSPDSIIWIHSELEASSSTVPSAREKRFAELLVQFLKSERSESTPESSFEYKARQWYATCLVNVAYHWKDMNLQNHVVQALAPRPIAVLGIQQLVAGYGIFGAATTKDMVLELIKTETSLVLQTRLLESLQAVVTLAHNISFASWCTAQLGSIFDGNANKLESEEVEVVLKCAKSQEDPSQTLRRSILARLVSVTRDDTEMWRILFDKLAKEIENRGSSFDRSTISQLIADCLHQIATELPLHTAQPIHIKARTMAPMPRAALLRPVATFVELCLRFRLGDPLQMLFMRLKNDLEDQEEKRGLCVASPCYSELVGALSSMIKTTSLEARKLLGTFFIHAVQAMLPHHTSQTSYDPDLPLHIACRQLEDPVRVLQDWLTEQQRKTVATRKDVLMTARNLMSILRAENRPQSVLNGCLSLLAPFVEERVKSLGSSDLPSRAQTRQSILDAIELHIAARASTSHFSGPLNEVLGVEPGSVTYICDGLLPFLRDLKNLLQRNHLALVDEPYSMFAAGVIKQYTTHVLQKRPCSQIPLRMLYKPSCGCDLCIKILGRVFMGGDTFQKRVRSNVSESEKNHLADHLTSMRSWGITWTVLKAKEESFELQINRPPEVIPLQKWGKTHLSEAWELFDSLGARKDQERIMGRLYAWAKESFEESMPPTYPMQNIPSGSALVPSPHAALPKRPLESDPHLRDQRDSTIKRPRLYYGDLY